MRNPRDVSSVCCLVGGLLVMMVGCGGSGGGGEPTTFSVGGTVSGLAGVLILQNNGADDLMTDTDGPFSFGSNFEDGAAFEVTVLSEPGVQRCRITNGSGTISELDAEVTVTCDHQVFFQATAEDGPETDFELWKTDGTEEGTVLVKNIDPEGSSSPHSFFPVGDGTVLFVAYDADGSEPWVTDGTEAGTRQLKNISEEGDSEPQHFARFGSVVYFDARSDLEGRELWTTDGTEEGTTMLPETSVGIFRGVESPVVDLDGTLYFAAADSNEGSDRELWTTQGATTSRAVNVNLGGSGVFSDPFVHRSALYFHGSDGTNTNHLFISDGTTEGTEVLKPGTATSPVDLTSVGDTLFFTAFGSARSLWKTDGTTAGTVKVREEGIDEPRFLTAFDAALFFQFTDAIDDHELWHSDGTEEGTAKFIDINDEGNATPENLTVVGDLLFFTAGDVEHGRELWVTDGTAAGTSLTRDIEEGEDGSFPFPVGQFFGELIFVGTTSTAGSELFISDGTEAGTRIIKDVCPGPCSGQD